MRGLKGGDLDGGSNGQILSVEILFFEILVDEFGYDQ